ncbi:MAG TPA: glycosyltransferase, partial [Tepidisphaeraceae bacterium]|nr:glycosyltransferase [Tepidisphaeraceae bacterium]
TLVVGGFSGSDPDRNLSEPSVVRMPNDVDRTAWARFWLGTRDQIGRSSGLARRALASAANNLAEPLRARDRFLGREEFRFAGTSRLLDLNGQPDVIHAHNLHGGYFDLRKLPWLSHSVPVCLTLHDPWLLAGHCSYPFDCERWKTGCGNCPRLDIYPSVRRDATRANWQTKSDIYRRSRIYLAAPSQWLLDQAKKSMLADAVIESRKIPYGVDLSIFAPVRDRAEVRAKLGLPFDAQVILYAANRLSTNPFKDFPTLRAAAERVGHDPTLKNTKLIFVALGDSGKTEQLGAAEVRFVPFQDDVKVIAQYYQAADLFVHAARADNFPNTILESLACGTPVVATAVGGIPEQIRALEFDRPTGILTPVGDAQSMSSAICRLLNDSTLRRQMSINARVEAEARFDLHAQRDAYLQWFDEMIDASTRNPEPAGSVNGGGR